MAQQLSIVVYSNGGIIREIFNAIAASMCDSTINTDPLGLNDIEHSKTKAYSPQTNGICERFHKTITLEEFYQIAFRKKVYLTLDDMTNQTLKVCNNFSA